MDPGLMQPDDVEQALWAEGFPRPFCCAKIGTIAWKKYTILAIIESFNFLPLGVLVVSWLAVLSMATSIYSSSRPPS